MAGNRAEPPSRAKVLVNKAVVKVNPYLKPNIALVPRVTRPAKYLKTHYNEGSKDIYQGISRILNGSPASSVLPGVQSQLQRLVSSSPLGAGPGRESWGRTRSP